MNQEQKSKGPWVLKDFTPEEIKQMRKDGLPEQLIQNVCESRRESILRPFKIRRDAEVSAETRRKLSAMGLKLKE